MQNAAGLPIIVMCTVITMALLAQLLYEADINTIKG